MNSYAFILGSHPCLSALEIYYLLKRMGHNAFETDFSVYPYALIIKTTKNLQPKEIISKLGGTPLILKLTKKTSQPNVDVLSQLIPAKKVKTKIGLSFVSLSSPKQKLSNKQLRQLGIQLKAKVNPKARMIFPQKGTELTSAQLFNHGFPAKGQAYHIIEVEQGQYLIGAVRAVQNIKKYSLRDYEKPGRDPKKGMLPPKAAQMLINFSSAPEGGTIYDPFCGTGTVMQEALLMELNTAGSDISSEQINKTKRNLSWLEENFSLSPALSRRIFTHNISAAIPPLKDNSIDAIVTEGWLGPLLAHPPTRQKIDQIFARVRDNLVNMLKNTKPLLKEKGKVVISIPSFSFQNKLIYAPFLKEDFFSSRGFVLDNLVPSDWQAQFPRVNAVNIIYQRKKALVARNIIRLTKIS